MVVVVLVLFYNFKFFDFIDKVIIFILKCYLGVCEILQQGWKMESFIFFNFVFKCIIFVCRFNGDKYICVKGVLSVIFKLINCFDEICQLYKEKVQEFVCCGFCFFGVVVKKNDEDWVFFGFLFMFDFLCEDIV